MRKSLWSFRTKHTPRHRIHSIVAITMAFAIDHLTADYVINLFGIPNGPARDWFDALYVLPFLAVGLWYAAMLNQEPKNSPLDPLTKHNTTA